MAKRELVDTHCHIQSIGRTIGDRGTRTRWAKISPKTTDQVIADAKTSGVTKLIVVGCDLPDSQLAVDFVQNQQNCWASIGVHPHEAERYIGQPGLLEDLKQLVSKPKVMAIGECGLDYYYEHSPREAQTEVLRFQLELASQSNLPLIFHVREAFDDFWPIFDQYKDLRGVLHSFTDSAANLQKALDRNLYLGVNGIATFTQDSGQLDVLKSIPLEKLLLETDSPFLTPSPYRDKINEPKYLGGVASFLADLREEDQTKLASVTTDNAHQLFGL